jgi:hypothetical protein
MINTGILVSRHSLYGFPPMNPCDLLFFGWIKPEEVLNINLSNYSNISDIKLKDINYPLTQSELNNGYKRVVKVMIKENFTGDRDEDFLLVYNKATEFDKILSNHAEFPTYGYNKGITIWHVHERVNMLNQFSDNFYDIELAVPYNGWYDDPVPWSNWMDYERLENWNGNYAKEYDYLDDMLLTWYGSVIKYKLAEPADGGQHIWETTTTPPYNHYPPDPTYFYRFQSLRSDFFTDESVRGIVSNKISDITRPSTKEWGASNFTPNAPKTHIAILNMQRENNGEYMSMTVKYNYWEGEIDKPVSTMVGDVIIANEVTLPAGRTLNIEPNTTLTFNQGAKLTIYGTLNVNGGEVIIPLNGIIEFKAGAGINFNNNSRLTVNGTVISAGTALNKVVFDFVQPSQSDPTNGITINPSGIINFNYSTIKNAYCGILLNQVPSTNAPFINYCAFQDNNYGIMAYDTDYEISEVYGARIFCSHFEDNYIGILLNESSPLVTTNTFINNGYGVYCANQSGAFFGEYLEPGVNTFDGNYDAFYSNYSSPVLGISLSPYEYVAGYNYFNYTISSNVYAEDNSEIYAELNWWGADPPDLDLFIEDDSRVYWDCWLSSQNRPLSTNIDNESQLIVGKLNPTLENKLSLARLAAIKGENEKALNIIRSILQKEISIEEAISVLETLSSVAKKDNYIDSVKNIINGLVNGSTNNNTNALANVLLGKLNKENGINVINNAIQTLPDLKVLDLLLFKKFSSYFHNKDLKSAINVLREMENSCPNSSLTLMAKNIFGEKNNFQTPKQKEDTTDLYSVSLSNFPNPFNPETVISFAIPSTSNVKLAIYDILGREVIVLVNEMMDEGRHDIHFDGSKLSSGVYIYRLTTKDFTASRKMMVVK